MLDLKYVQQNSDDVERNVRNRKSSADVTQVLKLERRRSELVQAISSMRQELNQSSKSKPDAQKIAELRQLGERIQEQEGQMREVESQLTAAAALLPNQSSPNMPVGAGEGDNVELKVWLPEQGYIDESQLGQTNDLRYASALPTATFADGQPKVHHLDLGQALGLIDMKQAAVVAGSRFAYLMGDLMVLQNALIQLLSQKLIAHHFQWMDVPLLVKEAVLFGTSHFPEGRDQVYQISTELLEEHLSLFLVGSSEPALFAFGMDRIFKQNELPLKMFAVTPCFRSEVGSWGKDVRGIKRVHQFTKLEMDVICTPDQAPAIFEELSGYNEWLLQQLQLPYRILNKCTGDCGYLATYEQRDVEVWLPSQQEFMETMTDTNATDFQARRMNIKYIDSEGNRQLVYTVNDTGAAMGRLLLAIMDNYQQPDGSIKVPDVLQPWVGKDVIVHSA
jgi:seryl-tRNA synthetase